MNPQQKEDSPIAQSDKPLYEGYVIPIFLKCLYTIYGLWAASYLIRFLIPDLLKHLSK